ncbi:MAG: hypothetical protein M1826_002760 [Phylliscum demangeonii]|nr:MAG: hypothetical protein M1826_002760 [Phylliscum demangeonii]
MSRSPPSTPSPPRSGLQLKQRFETMMDPTEWIEDYHPGGFHPVRLDEVFNDRYRVIRKLGYGAFSTVWLAVDAKRHAYVALKIVEAASSDSSHELSIFNMLEHHRASAAGAAYLIELQESFTHKGPNGTHLCLAFEWQFHDLYIPRQLRQTSSSRHRCRKPPMRRDQEAGPGARGDTGPTHTDIIARKHGQ